ncbi:MAG: Gfo/Idh/MocA family protein, partial [Acidimicrobiia bacterium]
ALHCQLLSELVEEVWLADVDRDRVRSVAEQFDVRPAEDTSEILATCDALVITAATSAHADLIIEGVDAGLPTFCEKPIALDLPMTRKVVDHVEANDGRVQVGFQRRFDRGFVEARRLIASGELGTLFVIRMAGHDPDPPHEEYIPESGGMFRDFSIHDFDALHFVTGDEVVEVYATGSVRAYPIFEKYGDIDTGTAILTLRSGAQGILSCTRRHPFGYDIRMELFGSDDSGVVGWDDRTPLRSLEPDGPRLPDNPYQNFQDRFRPAYAAELAAFVEYTAGRRENPCTVHDAEQALRVAVACDLSRVEHRPVRLEEVA